tara:strand:- start:4090 stop:8673 length:4584 start_codon:yes stop_codon:yes gene_type:complete
MINKLSNLSEYLKELGLADESSALISMAEDEQLKMFLDTASKIEDGPEEKEEPDNSNDAYSDRLDLSDIDFKSHLIPDDQIEYRKKIILSILKNNIEREKADVIEEVLMIDTDPGRFEQETIKYRNLYPELSAEILPAMYGQVRLPGIEPNPRIMPDPQIAKQKIDKVKDKLDSWDREESRKKEELQKKKEEFIKEHGREPRYWEVSTNLGMGTKPEPPHELAAVLNISPARYQQLKQNLFSKYKEAEAKALELSSLVEETASKMPPKPEPIADLALLSKFEDYIEDLKDRVYYYSYEVLADSAGLSIFGAPTGQDGYGSVANSFFDSEEEGWHEDPEALKDWLEKAPMHTAERYHNTWRSASPNVDVEGAYRYKMHSLESYINSLNRSMDSYKRGVRFLGRLKRDLGKEIDLRLGEKAKFQIEYIEKYYKDDLDSVYQKIINTLEGETERTSSYRYYNSKFKGGFKVSGYSSDGGYDEAFSMFDINLLFHNKIKMYEVINNFASLILSIINKTGKQAFEKVMSPAVSGAAVLINKKMVNKLVPIDNSHVEAGVKDIEQKLENDQIHKGQANAAIREMGDKIFDNTSFNSEFENEATQRWLEIYSSPSKNYHSMFKYLNFVIKDEEIRKLVSGHFKKKICWNLYEGFHSPSFGGASLRHPIEAVISEMLKSGEIMLTSRDSQSVINDIMKYEDIIIERTWNRSSTNTHASTSPLNRRIRIINDTPMSNALMKSEAINDYKELIELISFYPTSKYGAPSSSPKKEDRVEAAKFTLLKVLDGDSDYRAEELAFSSIRQYSKRFLLSLRKKEAELADHILYRMRISNHPAYDISSDGFMSKTFGINFSKEYDENRPASNRRGANDWYKTLIVPQEIDPDTYPVGWSESGLSPSDALDNLLNNFINFINNLKLTHYISKEEWIELYVAANPDKLKVVDGRLEVAEEWMKDSPMYSLESIDEKYNLYVGMVSNLNNVIIHARENFENALRQLKSIGYARYYMNLFAKRIDTFGAVGPRAMSRSYSDLPKRLKTPNIQYKALVKSWERDIHNQILDNVHYKILEHDDSHRVSNAWEAEDKITKFYSGANFNGIEGTPAPDAAAILISKKVGMDNTWAFEKLLKLCNEEFYSTGGYARNFGYSEFKRFIPMVFKDKSDGAVTKKDIVSLYKVSEFAHNRGANLPDSFFRKMINDPNFKDLGSNATVGKYFTLCTKLARMGGMAGVKRKSSNVIKALVSNGLVKRGFFKRLREINSICRSGSLRIRPNLEGLDGDALESQLNIRRLMEEVDADLTSIEDSAAYAKYTEMAVPKDKKLFKLDWNVKSKNFRFRVLKSFDPRALKIGVETGCCQRIGGYGEAAALDSYINPLAGVLILEIFATVDSNLAPQWHLATQSYFHYVPRDNSYILDNVERNRTWDSRVYQHTGYSTEELYAMLAKRMNESHNVEYFLSGKGYSKIDGDKFKKKRIDGDPRSFAWSKKYTDWQSSSSIDLLSPKFDVPDLPSGSKRKASIEELSQLVKYYRPDYRALKYINY